MSCHHNRQEYDPSECLYCREDEALRVEVARRLVEMKAERDSLRAFKVYVHQRLDEADVPVDPPGSHRDAGCRVGQRLDVLVGERDSLRAQVGALKMRALADVMAERENWRALVEQLRKAMVCGVEVLTCHASGNADDEECLNNHACSACDDYVDRNGPCRRAMKSAVAAADKALGR